MDLGTLRQWLHARCKQLQEASRAWRGRASLLCSLIRRSPHVLLVPLALFCLMTALGIWGVKTAVRNTEEAERSKAAVDADSASQALQLAIQRARLPLTQIAEIVKLMPQWSQLEKQWAVSAPAAWLGAQAGTAWLTVAPLGIARLFYPYNITVPYNVALLNGVNTLLPPFREATLGVLQAKSTVIYGPVIAENQYLGAVIGEPVYFSDMAANDTWDYKSFNEKLCPPGLCYNSTTRTRWWGMILAVLSMRILLGPEGALASLVRKGYQYELWHAPAPVGLQTIFNGDDSKMFRGDIKASLQEGFRGLVPMSKPYTNITEPDDAVSISVPVLDQTWELHVWKDSWTPSWMMPLIAVVVLGAFLVSVLVFTTLCSWAENRALLHSLLPKETIERMRNEGTWATGQDDEAIKTAWLETPAELMLRIIEDCIAGRSPAFPLLLSVRDALHRSADVYRPSEQQMRSRMDELANLDDDVRHALAAQLMEGVPSAMFARGGLTIDVDNDDVSSSTSQGKIECKLATASLDKDTVDVTDGTGLAAIHGTRTKSLEFSVSTGPGIINQASAISAKVTRCTGASLDPEPTRGLTNKLTSQETGLNSQNSVMGWCDGEVQPVLASWLLQRPSISRLVEDEKQQATAGNQASLLGRPNSLNDGTYGNCVEPLTVVMKPILTQLEKVLHTADDWAFDAFALEEASHGRPLSCLGYWLLHKTGLKSWAHIKTHRLINFLERIEAGYPNNPYHNKRHAADVLQSTHVILHRSGLMPGFADQLTLLGCYLSAIVHDFEHVGRTNDFLVNSSDELAVRYNDRSPMENHHLAAAWSILKTKECNILSGLPRPDVGKLRKLVIDLVLGTDMKQHFAIQGQFETMARQAHEQVTSERGSSNTRPHIARRPDDCEAIEVKPVNDQDQLLSLQMMLKCADLGHIAAPLQVHLRWVSALEAEFFLQGDAERALGLPISPLCDRTKEGVTKSQIGFFDFVVLPGFKTFCNRFTGASPLLSAVLGNQAYWKSLAAAHV